MAIKAIKAKKRDGQTEQQEERDVWSNPVEFFLTMLGYSVGPGNIVRFPYLCMSNGGAAFLIPYFICLFVCGMPLFFLELIMGQSSRKSCLGCWDRYGPLFKGVGYTMLLVSAMYIFEYQTVMAWILYYFAMSLTLELPWTSCNNTWNTPTCVATINSDVDATPANYSDDLIVNLDNLSIVQGQNTSSIVTDSAVEEFFQYQALQLSSGIDEVGGLLYGLVIAHLVSWVLIFICLIKGIRSAGKVVWVSATLPYIIITIFLVRAAMLPGFTDGINLYITPQFSYLKNPEVWMLAFIQIFYSLGPGWGGMISMASYNRYHHPFLIEAFLCPLACCFTSFYAGFVTFGVAGFLAHKKGLPVEKAMKSGPGIAFISYPELAAHLPGAPIWSALFFLMMANVLLTTMITLTNTITSAINESLKLPKHMHKYVLFLFALFNMLFGLIFFTNAGMYFFQLFDWYFAALGVFFTATVECLCVVWLYGYNRLYDDIYAMVGRRPFQYLFVPLWGVIIPVMLSVGMVWSVISLSSPKYGDYDYPAWCVTAGWSLAGSVLIPAVIYVIVRLLQARGPNFNSEIRKLIKPPQSEEQSEIIPMNSQNEKSISLIT